MKRGTLILLIDALMFLGLSALVGLGLLIKYVLLPGRETWAKYGSRVTLTWLGWDRHDWGTVHLVVAVIFLGLLAAHIILHWQMLVALYEKTLFPNRLRKLVAPAFVLLALLLMYFPALVTPEVQESPPGRGRRLGAADRPPFVVMNEPGVPTPGAGEADKPGTLPLGRKPGGRVTVSLPAKIAHD